MTCGDPDWGGFQTIQNALLKKAKHISFKSTPSSELGEGFNIKG
jgi:hypothetical protein